MSQSEPPSEAPGEWPFDGLQVAAGDDGLAGSYARVFAGGDGRRVLDHLRGQTVNRALGPGASDAALRHLEGQRALIASILALIVRGGGAL
ncbi:MAG: hypothetical protein VR70_09105 [Rhodospirillaceae bacterium BRH_c57]|nr:MAG: hypothetical protein VR70_09105 [Rhodospirillaceae bacterium BRH_c57]